MIQKAVESMEITSANPVHINRVIQINELDNTDLDSIIAKGSENTGDPKEQKKTDAALKKVELWDNGNIGEIQRFTSAQWGNLRDFVSNPVQFMVQAVFRKFAKGVGVAAFALLIFEAVQWIISELLKPGRMLDLRFKRDIRDEIIAFRRREDQQKLRQGFSNIIITSMPRMRGSPNQAAQTTNTLDSVRRGEFPENIGQDPVLIEASGVSLSKSKGRRTFRGPGR